MREHNTMALFIFTDSKLNSLICFGEFLLLRNHQRRSEKRILQPSLNPKIKKGEKLNLEIMKS
jgi:hypothetical protein